MDCQQTHDLEILTELSKITNVYVSGCLCSSGTFEYLQNVLPVQALKILPLTTCFDSPYMTPSWITAPSRGVRRFTLEVQLPVTLLVP